MGYNNILFCFICLVSGICLSIIMVLMELTLFVKKFHKHQKRRIRIREERDEGRVREVSRRERE